MRLGLFTDIHFQAKGLQRIIDTGKWIIEEFKRQGVSRVVCLGDSLNTREEVSVEAQSACIEFFKALAEEWPVEVLLGNHDMNLKHDRKVSSLDALVMHPRISLYREPGIVALDTCELLMLPYHEDQSTIVNLIQGLRDKVPERLANCVGIAHAGINGAVQITRYNTQFKGALGPDVFAPLKRTYTGHFHVHQRMDHRVTYVGSPLQFNFGDSGDTRGVMVYDTVTDEDHFIRNPFHDAFVILDADDLRRYESGELDHAALDEAVKGRFVSLVYSSTVTEDEYATDVATLEKWGAIQVRKESVIEKAITKAAEATAEVQAINIQTTADLVPYFVNEALDQDSQLDRQQAIDYGINLIRRVNERFQDVSDTGAIFEADIMWIYIQNFMGVQGPQLLRFDELTDGIWYLEGENGAGKSTILEAIVWCLFGQTIRNDMKVDDIVNDVVGKNCKVTLAYGNGWIFERFRKAGKDCLGYDNNPVSGNGVKCYFNGAYRPDMEKGEPKATQRKINDLLGIDYDKFIKTQIMGQNLTANFITADEKARRAMIEDMLGMERFDSYLEEVRAEKKALATEKEQQQSIQQLRAGELSRLTETISSIEHAIRTAKDEQQAKADELAQRIQDGKTQRKTAVDDWAKQERDLQQAITVRASEKDAAKVKMEELSAAMDTQAKAKSLAEEIRLIDRAVLTISAYGAAITRVEVQGKEDLARYDATLTELKARLPQLPEDYNEGKQQAMVQEVRILEQSLSEAESKRAIAQDARDRVWEHIKSIEASLTKPEAACSLCGQTLQGRDAKTRIQAHLDEERQKEAQLVAHLAEVGAYIEQKIQKIEALKAKIVDPVLVASHRTVKGQIEQAERERNDIPKIVAATQDQNLAAAISQYETVRGERPNSLMGCQEMVEDITILREQKAREAQRLIEDAKGPMEAYIAAKTAYEAAVQAHSDAVAALTSSTKAHTDFLAQIDRWIAHYENEITNLRSGVAISSLETNLTSEKAKYQQIRADLESAKERVVDITRQQGYVLFWDKAFASKGGMRSFMLRDSVRSLNELVAGYTSLLFNNGMTLTFTEELTVVESYGKRSGGQRKRTDLGCLFSTFDLSRQRLRYRSSMLCLDEAFDALDKAGMRAVQDIIALVAARLKKVLVITHADITGASMAGGIYAMLTDNGTVWQKRAI